ncbi:MAG TPA: acylphosphatase [Candidatus Eisenbacteria bacterium]|nr:acylphosphatase [Candidatus Eisenbacteria bacterium]
MSPLKAEARVHLKIEGRVQGVFFRASAAEQARRLGLTGWVMNRADGSVETVAEGARDKLEEFVAWCRQGPPGARVAKVSVAWEEPKNAYTRFTIER